MKKNTLRKNKGMTLLELTIVILVLLTLIGVLFFGAKAYKQGADRSACILNIRNVQQAMRAYCNMNQKNVGDDLASTDFIGADLFLEQEPECPGGGTYALDNTDVVPEPGVVYMTCDFDDGPSHSPTGSTNDW